VLAQVPVALFVEMAVPAEWDQLSTMGAGDGCGGVGAAGVDHHHLASESCADGPQADRQIALLIAHGLAMVR